MPPILFVVDRRENGKTLAAVLKTRYGISWSQAKRLVEKRHVKVGGQVETDVARRLKVGRRVELAAGTVEQKDSGGRKQEPEKAKAQPTPRARAGQRTPPAKPDRARPSATPLPASPFTPSLVYSDDFLVVANKPAGLTTMRHREEAAEFGERGKKFLPKTLADLLPGLLGAPGRLVIAVHRIDRDTSGLVVFARTRAAADHLTRQFRKHTVDRRYLAITRGVPAASRIESVFVRDRGDGRRGSTTKPDAPDAKRAVTHVKVLEEFGGFALVECRLETGRTHQVRIHLGEAGAPLCGEAVYDRPVNGKPAPDGSGAKRPMLHATRLGFTHPKSGEPMSWEIAPPADFAAVLEKLTPQPPSLRGKGEEGPSPGGGGVGEGS
jgi:23S rRNA pseudouridine1911/1915/1917 synthase